MTNEREICSLLLTCAFIGSTEIMIFHVASTVGGRVYSLTLFFELAQANL